MLAHGAYGGDHRIAGPESVTADEIAARVAAGLGRPVVYCPRPLAEFERDVDAAMGAGTGRRVASQANAMSGRDRSRRDQAWRISSRPTSGNGFAGMLRSFTKLTGWLRPAIRNVAASLDRGRSRSVIGRRRY